MIPVSRRQILRDAASGFGSMALFWILHQHQARADAAPKVYDLNASFYFYKRTFFELNFKTVFTSNSLIYEMPHICFDLDHTIDFEFLEFQVLHYVPDKA